MEAAIIISGIVSLIALIVFFIMSSNISAIRKTLESIKQKDDSINFTAPFNSGRIKEYQGKNQEALDLYMEAYYKLNAHSKLHPKDPNNEKSKNVMESKIKNLGGTVKELS